MRGAMPLLLLGGCGGGEAVITIVSLFGSEAAFEAAFAEAYAEAGLPMVCEVPGKVRPK